MSYPLLASLVPRLPLFCSVSDEKAGGSLGTRLLVCTVGLDVLHAYCTITRYR